ncbi:MAG: LOG family protein [Cyanobacteriota bacterium]|nr:LOG family protein [Cyanobacteriota bacterium]
MAVIALLEVARSELDQQEWRLISGCLADISEALEVFRPQRGNRKITVFGSARSQPDSAAARVAHDLSQLAVQAGFEVMTGAGGGVMEAANRGAGCDHSLGLNVDLPFEQHPNPFIDAPAGRLLHFRYFFTRKLFFLRESDALVVLPGGYGTLDELFESLTLIQTGRTPPIPLVLLAPEGDDFWTVWQEAIQRLLGDRGLISPEDTALLRQASSATEAVALISRFYRVFHSARLGEGRIELLLNAAIPDPWLPQLTAHWADLLADGAIQAGESVDDAGLLHPCLRFHFDRRRVGRLYQFIDHLNGLDLDGAAPLLTPGERFSIPYTTP